MNGARLIGVILLFTGAACHRWDQHVTRAGVPFAQVRREPNGVLIGELQEDTVIAGRHCRRGWVHLHPNGVPAGFTAGQELVLGRLAIPAGTWVMQDERQTIQVCAFPSDFEVQGHLCRGTGGPKGAQASFYPDGALKQFFPPRDTRIDGVMCAAGPVRGSVTLHENGRLRSARLAEPLARDGVTYPAGTRLEFDAAGRPQPAK